MCILRLYSIAARERLGSTISKNAAAQQAQPQFVLYVSVSALREFWITRFGMLTN